MLAGLTATGSSVAHTPYRLWDAFRKRNLQILTSHADYNGDEIGEKWVAVLREQLPLSRAMVSRARDLNRIASLLKTDQSKLAVLSHMQADQMFNGLGPFESYKPMPLSLLLDDGNYFLVARDNLPKSHGYFISGGLLQEPALNFSRPTRSLFGIPVHPGVLAFFSGETMSLESSSQS